MYAIQDTTKHIQIFSNQTIYTCIVNLKEF